MMPSNAGGNDKGNDDGSFPGAMVNNLRTDVTPVNEEADSRDDSIAFGLSSPIPVAALDTDGAVDPDKIFFSRLSRGFRTFKGSQDKDAKPLFSINLDDEEYMQPTSPAGTERLKRKLAAVAIVNFIDPTTVGSSVPETKPNRLRLRESDTTTSHRVENVFDKLNFIFQRDYGSVLRSVPFQRFRGGGNEMISTLPVTLSLARSSANAEAKTGANNANAPWGGAAGSSIVPVTDPSEWHMEPYCHVYIAACENIEQYRSKIRPSLHAFVSQIEAVKNSALRPATSVPSSPAGSGKDTNDAMAYFIIIYVPTGPRTSDVGESENNMATPARVGNALASRFQKARQRIVSMNSNASGASSNNSNGNIQELNNDSIHSTESLESTGDANSTSDGSEPGSAMLQALNKSEKTILRKIASEFPNGKTCVMSPTSLDIDDDGVSSGNLAIKAQEWNAFCRALAVVIGNGFKTRCQRYQDELKKLNAQRASPVKSPRNTSPSRFQKRTSLSSSVGEFNLSYFFLVKESLAFTFEQMQLPSEALLQYDEFRAFLPDPDGPFDVSDPSFLLIADSGDCAGFRRRIRSEKDLTSVAGVMRRYLFARELHLLFKMEDLAEVLLRCQDFAHSMYNIMLKPPKKSKLIPDPLAQERQAASWYIQFAWDVKTAADSCFFSLYSREERSMSDLLSVDNLETDQNVVEAISSDEIQTIKVIACRLGDILEVARVLLRRLGDLEFGKKENPVRIHEGRLIEEMVSKWGPWHRPDQDFSISSHGDKLVEDNTTTFLNNAFASPANFERKYLELLTSIVVLFRFASRSRLASRLQGEAAEIYIRNGKLVEGSSILKAIVKLCRWDQWDRCHFWRLFRLAYCQRTTALPTEYLKTLVTCFNPRTSSMAPTKALNCMQDDLESVMNEPVVGEARYGKLSFIETKLSISDMSADESTVGQRRERKTLLKRYCSVGEHLEISLTITSHLPRKIELFSIRLFVASFVDFSLLIENGESVEEEDAFRIISLGAPIVISPGVNEYTFDWIPMGSGQFVISTLELKWKEGYFYYDSMEMSAPLLGVDVLPSDPTHSISIDPPYLVPGHDQQVKIIFQSRSDMVTGGKAILSCSSGVQLLSPNEESSSENWQEACELSVSHCPPGEHIVYTIRVKCDPLKVLVQTSEICSVESADRIPGLKALVATTYLHSQYNKDADSNTHHMKTVLEAIAPIREQTALVVDSIDAIWYPSETKAIINISLSCHTPHTIAVDAWELLILGPLSVSEKNIQNEGVHETVLSEGESLSLSFECEVIGQLDSGLAKLPSLRLSLHDESGKKSVLDLPIDLSSLVVKQNTDNSMDGSLAVSADLKMDVDGCNIGETVVMNFFINANGVSENRQLLYAVTKTGSDWILGGKMAGTVILGDLARPVCSLIAIPARLGIIETFPFMCVWYMSEGKRIPIKVNMTLPPAFQSTHSTYCVSIASASAKP